MEELEFDFTDLFNQRSKAETQTLKMKESLEDATNQFSKKEMVLRTHIAHDAKLQKFMMTKLQKIILSVQEKDSKTKERTKPVETYVQSYNALVEANRESNLSQIGLAFTTNKRTNLVLMNYITDLHAQSNMLEISTENIKNDILMLEQARLHEEDSMNHLKELESELENHISLGDSLEEQRRVVQRAVDQLTASIRGLLDDGSVTVAADNIALCIGKLVENIHNLLIQANSETDEQSLQLANFALLPDIDTPTNSMSDIESAVDKEHSRTSSGSSFRSTASSRK
ncbi:coiled-coil domain-containing protein 63-like [Menidia menidia]